VSDTSEPVSDVDATAAPTFDSAHFRSVLGHFCSGITIITAVDDGEPVGLTCQSFTSISLEPPLVGFVPSKTSTSWPRIQRGGVFCVNVLGEDQEDLCRVFATPGADKFRGVGWRPSGLGAPIIEDTLAWVDCRIVAEHDAGDHSIVLGRVADLAAAPKGKPLLFYRGGYGRFES
jgi:3-hydroxy-9,10-secoandrosta-1,3,5(10)-triene-9,17-dione monooxygenase reductase component